MHRYAASRTTSGARSSGARQLALALGLVALALCLGPGIAGAQPGASLDALNRKLETLSREHGGARRAGEGLGAMIAVAMQRQELLAGLLERDPGAVLALALPAEVRERLPVAVQAKIERPVEVEGELTVLYEDGGNRTALRHYLEANGGRRSLHFAEEPPDLRTGDRVLVRGMEVPVWSGAASSAVVAYCCGGDGLLALAGGSGGGPKKGDGDADGSPPATGATGERRVLTILVNFEDDPLELFSPSAAREIVFGTTNDFLVESSYEQLWLTGDVAGWFTLPLPSTECDLFAIASHARSAASAAGFDPTAYDHLVYSFPRGACNGLGVGTVGGNPSQAWIIDGLDLKVLSHELGHNLGLYHARALDCGTSVLGSDCTVFEYGDRFDTMGNVTAGHYHAFHKDLLGWFAAAGAPSVTEVGTDGVYTLEPLEMAGTGPAALAILKAPASADAAETWYYVEYRRPLGFDAFLATYENVTNGVVVHTGAPSNSNSSYLLDMTPGSGLQNWSDWSDPALGVGMSFHDPDAGLTITTLSAGDTMAEVLVSFGTGLPGPEDVGSDLEVTATCDRAVYAWNQTALISATVTAGGVPVAGASVSFRITNPEGDTTLLRATTRTDGVAAVEERLRRRDPRGRYEVQAEATTSASRTDVAWTSFTLE